MLAEHSFITTYQTIFRLSIKSQFCLPSGQKTHHASCCHASHTAASTTHETAGSSSVTGLLLVVLLLLAHLRITSGGTAGTIHAVIVQKTLLVDRHLFSELSRILSSAGCTIGMLPLSQTGCLCRNKKKGREPMVR